MRNRKLVIVPVLALAVFALLAAPAAAQNTYISLRYWPARTDVSLSGGPSFRAFDNNMISLSVRRMWQAPWSLSFNLDTGSNSNLAGTWAAGTNSSSTYWNVNLHRDFRGQNTNASIFLGYQNARERTTFASEQTHTVNGLRVGADLMWHTGPWSLQAWGAVGISPHGETTQPGLVTGTGTGSYNEYGALVGYTFSSWTIEAGYRWLNFGVPAGGSFLAADFKASGFTFGISRIW